MRARRGDGRKDCKRNREHASNAKKKTKRDNEQIRWGPFHSVEGRVKIGPEDYAKCSSARLFKFYLGSGERAKSTITDSEGRKTNMRQDVVVRAFEGNHQKLARTSEAQGKRSRYQTQNSATKRGSKYKKWQGRGFRVWSQLHAGLENWNGSPLT